MADIHDEENTESISLTAKKITVTPELVKFIADKLHDASGPIGPRFRALFTLRNLGGKLAIDAMVKTLKEDKSALLKHEIGYCLGQMRDVYAVPFLSEVLANTEEESIVRHEAGEALGAIADDSCIPVLEKFCQDELVEIRETCEIALERIKWGKSEIQNQVTDDPFGPSKYFSVDPAPAIYSELSVDELSTMLNTRDGSVSLFKRYNAMFALRDICTEESVDALCLSLSPDEPSALLKHEVAFVLGQMSHPRAAEALNDIIKRSEEHCMVRHEAIEALGAIAVAGVEDVLKERANDEQEVVRQSAQVGLDMAEYYSSGAFEYADG
eukprot:CAMPEP_0184331752 /NCGR_PEP_ID=MMETSP1089-20130417/1038_1 /TAXON_ID=38269 ORGANISM="Gloeochaete wittrockiana, Strain SAG46.84" /NCGR_SAMPLE_ID=MMETSP1089 /ASSEMBLY_ACC=CAM_ASM_000445 /LENGTH=325 /DNA_ID=CAMNT_0026654829 /DNA_START=94 /DNA_END=1067 /DNA_ORIENTATION=+